MSKKEKEMRTETVYTLSKSRKRKIVTIFFYRKPQREGLKDGSLFSAVRSIQNKSRVKTTSEIKIKICVNEM